MLAKKITYTNGNKPKNIYDKKRVIFLESTFKKVKNENGIIQILPLQNGRIVIPNVRNITVSNISRTIQNHPDNAIITEEVLTSNMYFGTITMDLDVKEYNSKNIRKNNFIQFYDYNFNIVFNTINQTKTWFETYNRFSPFSRQSLYRELANREIHIRCPIPKYYTYEEQKAVDNTYEDMATLIDENIKNHNKSNCLFSCKVEDLIDENTYFSELNLIFNNFSELFNVGYENFRLTLSQDIQRIVASLRYDMDNFGVQSMICIMTSKKGFNITQMFSRVQYNPILEKQLIQIMLDCTQRIYEEQFKSLSFQLGNSFDLQLFLFLEPINNVIQVYLEDSNGDKTDMSAYSVQENICNSLM